MAAPKPFVIFALVLAGLLLLLFVLGAAGTFELPRPDVRSLKKKLGAPRVPLGALSAESARACTIGGDALQIPAGGLCSLMAPASDAPVWKRRAIALRTDGRVEVVVVPAGDAPRVDGKPDSGDEVEFALPREGARVDLACAGTEKCTVTWLR